MFKKGVVTPYFISISLSEVEYKKKRGRVSFGIGMSVGRQGTGERREGGLDWVTRRIESCRWSVLLLRPTILFCFEPNCCRWMACNQLNRTKRREGRMNGS